MKILTHDSVGETRTAFVDESGVRELIVHRDLALNFGDIVMAKITAFHPVLKGYFAETDKGNLFIPTGETLREGESVRVQITKEARPGKEATAHLVSDKTAEMVFPTGEAISAEEMDEITESALKADVSLVNGGELHISQTPVCWVIDVDSGSFQGSLADLNRVAAVAIARQIRLKNMGGLILIDFAGSKRGAVRQSLTESLEQVVKGDNLIADMAWTKAGLMEVERRRERADLWMLFRSQNPLAAYYRVRRAIAACPSGNPIVRVSPDIYRLLTAHPVRARLEVIFDKPLSYFEIDEEHYG